MGSLVKGIGQGLGIIADEDAGSGAYRESGDILRNAVAELEKIGIPSAEAQKIALNLPQVVGQLQAQELGDTAFEDIVQDPQLRQNILDAIGAEREASETGFSDEDQARLEALRRGVQADESARQASILQSLSERGALGGGSELAARLSSAQGSADRARQEALTLGQQGAQNRRAALSNLANLSSGLSREDFARQSQQASARDQIARFNAMQRADVAGRNLSNQQNIANQQTALRNQQQLHNKGLIQQNFQNQLAKAQGVFGGQQALSGQLRAQGQAEAQAAQQGAAGTRALLLGGAKAAFGGGFQDGGVQDPNMIVSNPYTQPKRFNDGGSPASFDENGNRIDELIDAGEYEVNPAAQEELMEMFRGNISPEEMTEGRIVEGDSFSGDLLPDRINSGEMVTNIGQQDQTKETIENDAKELEGIKTLLRMLGEKKR